MNKESVFLQNIENRLFQMKDDQYAEFSAKLNPIVSRETFIGVRNPQIKALAKEFSHDPDRLLFLSHLPHNYFEENMLHGVLLNSSSTKIEEIILNVEKFLPYIDNWAVCDTTCMSLKIFKKYPDIVYPHVTKWLQSTDIYTIRFGIVTLLDYYLDKNYTDDISELVANVKEEDYYVKMAMAWYFSTALIKQYDSTIHYFQHDDNQNDGTYKLSKWVHNKSIQKAIESFRISDERKLLLRSMRI